MGKVERGKNYWVWILNHLVLKSLTTWKCFIVVFLTRMEVIEHDLKTFYYFYVALWKKQPTATPKMVKLT